MRPIDLALKIGGFVSSLAKAIPSSQRVLQAAGTLYFTAAHIRPPETATWLIARRFRRFLPLATFLRQPQNTQVLVLRVAAGEEIPFYYNGSDVPLGMMSAIFQGGIYRSSALRPTLARTIIDCGGHIGSSVAWFLRRFPGATVHAFEPGKVNYHHLGLNIRAWNAEARVVLNAKAVWSSSTEKQLFHYPQGSIGDSLFPDPSASSERVTTIRLDEYLREKGIKKVDLLKLNIEGSELEALKGLGERIKDVRVIMGEIHPDFVDPESVLEFLRDNGFRIVLKHKPDSSMLFEATAI